jgi:hypothetical protein
MVIGAPPKVIDEVTSWVAANTPLLRVAPKTIIITKALIRI